MQNQLFRQESIDRISSPEQVKDYLRVTSPRIWMVLAAAAVLIAGFLFYLSAAGNEMTLPVKVVVENTQEDGPDRVAVFFRVPAGEKDNYREGMKVRFAGETGKIGYFVSTGDTVDVSVTPDNPEAAIADGEYDAEVVTETVTAIGELLE